VEINLLRALATLAVFAGFIGICVVVYSRKRKAFYEDAARIPLRDQCPADAGEENP